MSQQKDDQQDQAPNAPERPTVEAARSASPRWKIERFTPDTKQRAFLCAVGGKGGLWTHHEAINGGYGGKGWCRAADVEKLECALEQFRAALQRIVDGGDGEAACRCEDHHAPECCRSVPGFCCSFCIAEGALQDAESGGSEAARAGKDDVSLAPSAPASSSKKASR